MSLNSANKIPWGGCKRSRGSVSPSRASLTWSAAGGDGGVRGGEHRIISRYPRGADEDGSDH